MLGVLTLMAVRMVLNTEQDQDNTTVIVNQPVLDLYTSVEHLPTVTSSPTPLVTATAIPSPTVVPTFTAAATTRTSSPTTNPPTVLAQAPTATPDVTRTPGCTPPANWEAYTVQDGDTLFAFQLGAGRAGTPTNVDEIVAANCLGNRWLFVGQVLYLPAGAAENAPASEPVAPALPAGVSRDADCPCTLTIRPGWRLEQIADQINRTPVAFSGADFMAAAGPGAALPPRGFLASVPPGNGLEGFMLPGTYTLDNSTTAVAFRDMVLNAFEASAAGVMTSATAQGISPYEALILASIVQRESRNASEQRLVASVFYNRLATGRAFGATVTIQYALGRPGNWWPRLQRGQTSIDSPYNTYRFQGFTPTPISNADITAIQAVAAPAQTDYLYFTGNCRGPGNAYARTYEEHLANVNCE